MKVQERLRLASIGGSLLVMFFLYLGLLLLALRFYVGGEIASQEVLLQTQKGALGAPGLKEMHEANRRIAGLLSFYAEEQKASDVIERVAAAVPEGVRLTSFTWQGNTIALKGFAPSREHLLAFRDALEAEDAFGKFRFPPSNWVSPIDITFAFDFTLL